MQRIGVARLQLQHLPEHGLRFLPPARLKILESRLQRLGYADDRGGAILRRCRQGATAFLVFIAAATGTGRIACRLHRGLILALNSALLFHGASLNMISSKKDLIIEYYENTKIDDTFACPLPREEREP